MTKTCLNCNTPLHGHYCGNCGQDAETHKMNTHFLWHDVQHGLLHFDKGIFFTAKELFTRPGHSIREFLEGKRVKHFKPISLVIVLAGVYGFLSHYYKIDMLTGNFQISGSGKNFDYVKETVNKISEWIAQHYAILALAQVPVFAIGTYLGFKKAGYNFIEHLVIHSFLTGQRLLLHLAAFPLYYIFNKTKALNIAVKSIDIISYALTAWSVFQLFNILSIRQRIWRTILSSFISFVLFLLILVGLAMYFVRILKL